MLEMADVGNRQVFSQEQLSFDERKGRRKSSGIVSFYRPLGCFDDGGDGGWTINHWCQSYGSRYSTVPKVITYHLLILSVFSGPQLPPTKWNR